MSETLKSKSVAYVIVTTIFIVILVLFSMFLEERSNSLNWILFLGISLPVIFATIYLAGSTIYLNQASVTKGPVHWHADYQIWTCGERIQLVDPKGMSNKIGSSVMHEHNDDRMHVEGVVMDLEDVNLGNYFEVVGGHLENDWIMLPTNEGQITYGEGDLCNEQESNLKVYVNGKKIENPEKYVPSPEQNVPPGDCIIFDFDPGNLGTTDKLCESWEANGWNYENQEMMKNSQESIAKDSMMDNHDNSDGHHDNDDMMEIDHDMEETHEHDEVSLGHDHGIKIDHLNTFGPGEAPHKHAIDYSEIDKVEDISRDPSDIPAPITRNYEELVKFNLVAKEVISEIAPGISYNYWTYNNTVPGPLLRVREGDTVELTLTNSEESTHSHSIDLHAVTGPGGGATMTQVKPGETKTIRFKALNPGSFVYHCATANVPMHMTNGMYGMILVDPKEPLSQVDKEFYVMQGELYTEGEIGNKGFQEFDPVKMFNENPEYVLFNGRIKSLIDHPLIANVGEKIRIYFGNGGVSLISSFHVIGEIFDTVNPEAGSLKNHNVQTTIVPAGGATVTEIELNTGGNYILVDHALSRLEKGAWGILSAEGEENPEIYDGVR